MQRDHIQITGASSPVLVGSFFDAWVSLVLSELVIELEGAQIADLDYVKIILSMTRSSLYVHFIPLFRSEI